jgi:hypothetical protein
MEKLITELKKKYDLSLGNKSFSPIMQLSIGLAMKYHEEVENGFHKPFHLNFPDKQDSALWLSVALMRNFLLDDYINQPLNRIEDYGIIKGDKVELFGAICTYEGSIEDKICLGFSDQDSPITITNKLVRYVNTTNKKRVNMFRFFGKKKKEARASRNAISKLLEPIEPILVNEKILESKVLVIAGRGDSGNFSQRLKDERLFETSLHELFNCGQNLIIKPDLEDFMFLGKKEEPIVEERFKKRFLRFIDELIEELPDRENDIDSLVENIQENDFRTKEFKNLFDEIVSECDQESKYHKIKEIYPGIKEKLPKNLKSVVINDITQLETYRGVIEELLRRRIPVLVISNRYIEDKKAISFFDNYFKTHTEDLRISWDKKKIREICKPSLNVENSLDYDLWKKCLKFSKQIIKIETTESHPVDDLLMDVQRAISNLEGQERLRNAYWRFFNPLIYSFKNSAFFESYHDDLLTQFLSVFEEVKVTLTQDLRSVFDRIINDLKDNRESFKIFDEKAILFCQHIDFEDKSVIFPRGDYTYLTNENINNSTSQITFPGFPLNEPLNNFLLDSINEHIIKDITIVCWPKEGLLTYNYIINRLKAGYYSDNIPIMWGFPDHLLLKDEKDIQSEIHETLILDLESKIDVVENNIEAEEEILRKISTFKYSAYQNGNSFEYNAKVSCNIIDFQGNIFMFLPNTSSVLAKIETEGDKYQIKQAKYNDLKTGDEIFQYELSRHRLRELSKDADYRDNIFSKLELWKDSLKKSFMEEGYDLKKLLKRLKRVNSEYSLDASPSYQNLRNWLYDEDMLSPEKQNLQMILYADSDTKCINEFLNTYDAYKKARSLSRKVSSEIKKLIIKKLKSMNLSDKSNFEIKVFGSPMGIEFRKIKALQKAEIEVEYQHTRKFIE